MRTKIDFNLCGMILCAIAATYLISSKVISETTNTADITKPIIAPGTPKNKPLTMPDMLEEKYPVMARLVKVYVSLGGDINEKDKYGNGNTLLHLAAVIDQHELAEILILMGANVNLTNSRGLNPIHLAAQKNSIKTAKLLIANDADIFVQSKILQGTALFYAASYGFKNFVQLLLEEQPSLINVANKYGNTPLHIASVKGCNNVVVHLLEYPELNLNDQTFYGNTAVHKAVMGGHYEIASVLIKSGANLNIKNRMNHTALSMAREEGRNNIFTLLQSNNAGDSDNMITKSANQRAFKLLEQGNTFFNKKNYKKAKALYLEALELNPNYAYIYNALANGSWKFENDLEQAERYMKKSIELDPFFEESYYWRGRINHMLNRPEVYKPMFLKYIELAPDTYKTKVLIQNFSHLLK